MGATTGVDGWAGSAAGALGLISGVIVAGGGLDGAGAGSGAGAAGGVATGAGNGAEMPVGLVFCLIGAGCFTPGAGTPGTEGTGLKFSSSSFGIPSA